MSSRFAKHQKGRGGRMFKDLQVPLGLESRLGNLFVSCWPSVTDSSVLLSQVRFWLLVYFYH